ncbi:MAG: hypothetical protein IT317_03275 [Anaerolineales bacterium]|nr:hypothetical protein [Anaerolineales bacterium]
MAKAKRSEPNPLLTRLKRGSSRLSGRAGLAAAALVCGWVWYGQLAAWSGRGGPLDPFLPYALALCFALALLIFLPILAANLTATYARSAEYALVCSTPLTDAALMSAFVNATLYRSRAFTLLALGSLPLVAAYAPLPWPGSMLIPLSSRGGLPSADVLARWLYFAVVLEVAFVGLLRWMVSVGVVMALLIPWAAGAGLVGLLVPVVVWLSAAAYLNDASENVVWSLAWTTALTIVTYGLARLTERWGGRWARIGPNPALRDHRR